MKRKYITWGLVLLILLTVSFIFSQSCFSREESQQESDQVLEFLSAPFEVLFGVEELSSNFVRKLAHFTEFFVLGAELSGLLLYTERRHLQPYINAAAVGSLVALCDETLQLFTGRGSQVQDVWLDISGALCGLILVLAVFLIVNAMRKAGPGKSTAKKG